MTRLLRAPFAAALVALAVVTVSADEIRVMTSGAFTAPYLELGPQFERSNPHTVITSATSMGVGALSIPNRIKSGEPVDVVILPDETIDQLIRAGLVVAGSKVALARSTIGMAVRAGTAKPDISTVDAFRRTLLQAQSIAISASVSGDYLSTELFPRLGIADRLRPKTQRIERERVGAVVARGEAEIGFQQVSELLPIAGIDFVGPLPAEVQRVTTLSAAVVAGAKSADAARLLIRFLAAPGAIDAIRRNGLEPIGF